MKKNFHLLCFLITCKFLFSCAGTVHTSKKPTYNTQKFKKAFIVSAENSKYIKFRFGIITPVAYIVLPDKEPIEHEKIGDTDLVIKEELEKRGIKAEIGNKGSIPTDIDLIVLYNDIWRWDMKKVLDRLDIVFISPENQEELAKSIFNIYHNKEFHNFPNPKKEVPKMIEQLLKD